MADRYLLVTQGTVPVKSSDLKEDLKITTKADDRFVKLLIRTATDFAEKYTRQDFRAKTWRLFIDKFADRICLRRNPIASITTVKFLDDSAVPVQRTVANSVYYLKNGVQASEVLLQPDQEWPDGSTLALTVNEREHSIEIDFLTQAHPCLDQARLGIERHVAFMYENRGDCDPHAGESSAKVSGATTLYDPIRVSRV